MTREFLDSVDDMLNAIQKTRSFCAGMTFKSFAKDDKTVYAVIHAIEIIGEAAKRVPPSVRRKYPSIPWRETSPACVTSLSTNTLVWIFKRSGPLFGRIFRLSCHSSSACAMIMRTRRRIIASGPQPPWRRRPRLRLRSFSFTVAAGRRPAESAGDGTAVIRPPSGRPLRRP